MIYADLSCAYSSPVRLCRTPERNQILGELAYNFHYKTPSAICKIVVIKIFKIIIKPFKNIVLNVSSGSRID
jgi:hypothetical protein